MNLPTFLTSLLGLQAIPDAYADRAQTLAATMDDGKRALFFVQLQKVNDEMEKDRIKRMQTLAAQEKLLGEFEHKANRLERSQAEQADRAAQHTDSILSNS